MAYGKGRVVNTKSSLYNEEVTIDQYISYRDGSMSAWCTLSDGTEVSFKESDIELMEVFRP